MSPTRHLRPVPTPTAGTALTFADRARIAARAPYVGSDMTYRDIDAVMGWLTDLAPTIRLTGLSTACSTLWLQAAVLLQRLGHADTDELDRRLDAFTTGIEALRGRLGRRLADEADRYGMIPAALAA